MHGDPGGEHGAERPAPHHAGREDPHHQRHLARKGPLDEAGQCPLHQGRPQPAQGGAGDEQDTAREIEAQGAAQHQQQQGRAEQGAWPGLVDQGRGEQHADPDQQQRQQGDPGQPVHPERQLGIYLPRQGADGGEEGAQVDANEHHQHQQGAAAGGKRALNHGTGGRRARRQGWGLAA